MVLPTSGSLSYNSIRAEFGSPSTNVYLSLYYRGGPYTYNVPANSNITTNNSASIAVNDFYGARGKTDYAAGPFGTYTSGGKIPDQFGGVGGPNLPSMTDTSIRTNVLNSSVTKNYGGAPALGVSVFVMGPFASGNTPANRTFRYYLTNGSLWRQFTFLSTETQEPSGDVIVSTLDSPKTNFSGAGSGEISVATPWRNSNAVAVFKGF